MPYRHRGVARLADEEILFACILVGKPNPLVAGVEDRMPVILMPTITIAGKRYYAHTSQQDEGPR